MRLGFKIGLARLPFRAASFVTLVCIAILGLSATREWSAREAALKLVEVDQANHRDGRFAGIAIASIASAYFSDFYHQFDIGESGSISLLSDDGIILARRPDDGINAAGRDVSDGQFFKAIRSGGFSGAHILLSSLDGLRRLGFHQRSSRPFGVLTTKAQDEILAQWRRATVTRMAVVLGLVVLIAVMGFYLVRELLRGQQMAAALASKEANFRVVAEGSSDMVTRIGLDEQIYYASPLSVRIVGRRPDQLVGTPALSGVNPLDLSRVQQVVAALKRGEVEETRITYRTRHREKSEIWVESTMRVTQNGGKIDGVVVITRDVTQQKTLEGRLETLATVDGLTGLANRRRFDERLL